MKRIRPMRRIRPVKPIFFLLSAFLVAGALIFLYGYFSKSAEAAWFDDNWKYRKSIAITAHTASENNVYINLTGASDLDTSDTTKFQTDCGDLRFTKENGELLPYYVVSGCGTADTVVHVNFDAFPAGAQTIYYYYGNPSASDGFSSADFATEAANYTLGSQGTEEKAPSPLLYLQFNEGQGTTANDSSGQSNTGTLAGATLPTWQTEDLCVFGKCLFFGGDPAEVTVANTVSGVKSVGFWVRPKTNGEYMLDLDGGTHYIWGNNGTITATGFDSPTIYVNGKVSSTLTANTWQYVEVTTSTGIDASAIHIGKGNTTYFTGFIDEIKMYDYVRTAAQVKADYASKGSVKGVSASLGGPSAGSGLPAWLSNGLVGYWKMDETSWGSVVDSSGNSNTGTATGATGGSAGKFGNSGLFDNATDIVNAGSGSSLDNLTNWTYSAWIRPTNFTTGYAIRIITKGDGGIGSNGRVLMLEPNTGQISANQGYSGTDANSKTSTTLTLNTWTHVTATFNSTDRYVKIYFNGVEQPYTDYIQGPNAALIDDSSLNLGIGNAPAGVNRGFIGSLDEVRVYNRTLSSKEVSDLYNWAPGPVGYWNFEEKTGVTAYNTGTNANHGTLTDANLVNGDGNTPPKWTNAKYGSGIQFDGTDDYVNLVTNDAFDSLTQGTVEAWVNLSAAAPDGYEQILFAGTDSCGSPFEFTVRKTSATAARFEIWGDADGGCTASFNAYSSITTPFGRWHHLAYTVDSSGNSLYIDGVKQTPTYAAGTSTSTFFFASVATGTTHYHFGKDYNATSELFYGALDEVKIYNYARTQKQIVSDMNAGHPAVGSPVGSPVTYWDMDEGQSTTAHDLTPNGNDLTLSSASWTNAGKFGKAWNGTNAVWASRADDADFDVSDTDDYAVSLWFKSDSADNPAATEYLVNKANATTAGYAVYANTDGTVCFGIDDDTTWGPDVSSCSSTDIYDATWHHLVAARDHNNTDKTLIYIDGILKDSDTDSTTATLANSLSFYLGDRDGTNNGDEFSGDLDEAKVYRYALTTDEVKTEFNRGSSLVLGAAGNSSTYSSQAANQEYCVPGDTTSCAAPVGEWKFEEKTGTSANDTSGNGNTTTLTNSPSWISGKYGGAIKFNGTNQYVHLNGSFNGGSTPSLDFTNPGITIEGWVKLNSLQSGERAVLRREGQWALEIFPSDGKVRNLLGTSGTTGWTASNDENYTFATNRWYFLAFTYNGSVQKHFVNGSQLGTDKTVTGDLLDLGRNIDIGGDSFNNGEYLDGIADEVKIYNYARTPAQIAWDYNRGKPVAHWKFDECQDTTIHDSSGNNYSGTWAAGTTYTQAGTCTDGNAASAWYGGRNGKFNSSLDFDGTATNRVTIDTAINGVQSVSFWVKPTTNTDSFMDLDGGTHYITASSGTVSATGFTSPTIYVNGVSGGAVTAGAWNHIVVTTATSFNTTTSFTLGYKSAASADYLTGQLDDVKIFNYALTATQVKDVYNNGAVFFGPSTGSP